MMQLNNSYSMSSIGHLSMSSIGHLLETGKECHDNNNCEEAIRWYTDAYKLARELNNDEIERLCAFNVGAEYVCQRNAVEGLNYLHKACPPNGQRDGNSNADLYLNFGYCYEQYDSPKMEEALGSFEKAFKECKEHDCNNLDLLNQCYDKCMEYYVKLKSFSDAAILCQEMANVYAHRNSYIDQAEKLVEKANMMYFDPKCGGEKVLQVVDDTFNVIRAAEPVRNDCLTASKVLNDLGLLRTQLKNFERATECFEKALEMMNMSQEPGQRRDRLAAVILQNLGAAYNFVGDFQKAITFLKMAADGYGKLKYRNGEGQCFINLAYAYSQTAQTDSDALENTKTYFNHALLAAQTTGDRHMMWQAYEGLGDAFYNSGKMTKARDYYRGAYDYIEDLNRRARDRIWMKLEYVIKIQPGVVPVKTQEPYGLNGSHNHFAVSPGRQSYTPTQDSQGFSMPMQDMEEEEIIRKEFLPMAAVAQPLMSRIQEHPVRPRPMAFRQCGTKAVAWQGKKPSDLGATPIVEEIFAKRSEPLLQKMPAAQDDPLQAYMAAIQEKEEEETASSDSSDRVYTDDESTESEDESQANIADKQEAARRAPPLPSQSPPHTGTVGTYLKPAPAHRNIHRSNDDSFDSDTSENQATGSAQNGLKDESDESEDSTESDDEENTARKDDDPPYATIASVNRTRPEPVTEDGSDQEVDFPESKVAKMPRGQREQFLMEQHQKRAPPLPPRSQEGKSSKTCVVM